MRPLPKFPFTLNICGRDFQVTREPIEDGYGESSAMDRVIALSTADHPKWPLPDHMVWEVLAHEVMHMVLALNGVVTEDNSGGSLTRVEEELVCVAAETLWATMQSVPSKNNDSPRSGRGHRRRSGRRAIKRRSD